VLLAFWDWGPCGRIRRRRNDNDLMLKCYLFGIACAVVDGRDEVGDGEW
jgi:hypothetical protein